MELMQESLGILLRSNVEQPSAQSPTMQCEQTGLQPQTNKKTMSHMTSKDSER